MMKSIIKYTIILSCLFLYACNDLLDNELPSNQIGNDEAIKSVEELQQLLNSSYDVTANGFNGNSQRFNELLADNVKILGNSGFLVQIFNRGSDFFNSDVGGYYGEPYVAILRANTILEKMNSIVLSDSEHDRIEGEAKFLRAINHFELVNHFAQPFGYTSDNSHLGIVVKSSSQIGTDVRSAVSVAYELIEADLKDAETLLPVENGNYATVYAAKAFLAKMYFQMNDFSQAASYAKDVIDNSPYVFSDDLNNRYSATVSSESIFTTISTGTEDNRAKNFKEMYDSRVSIPVIQVSDDYFNLVAASGGDRTAWIFDTGDSKVFTKFNMDFMDVSITNLTELMLIAAESNAELNQDLSGSIGYINAIKQRANVSLMLLTASSELIVSEARKERRIEFGGEGKRLMELKRRGVLGEDVLIRNAPWDCDGMALQFPASELSIKGFVMNPEGGCN